jgi:hypothetical protein
MESILLACPSEKEAGRNLKNTAESEYTGVVFQALRDLHDAEPDGTMIICPFALACSPMNSLEFCDMLYILRVKGWETDGDIERLASEAMSQGKPEFFLTPYIADGLKFSLTPTDEPHLDSFDLEGIPKWMAHGLPSS